MADIQVVSILRPTREYFRLVVNLADAGVVINPSPYVAEYAFMPLGTIPSESDWVSASWTHEGTDWISHALISGVDDGSGAFVITGSDLWDVYWRITVDPERMVRKVAQLRAA